MSVLLFDLTSDVVTGRQFQENIHICCTGRACRVNDLKLTL